MNFTLDKFEGPLDLLLHLISSAKIDIKDIFVSHITEQYLEVLAGADDLDMGEASEFAAMAATLIEIKSRSMLPKPPRADEEYEDPAQELIRRLTEYAAYKKAAQELTVFERSGAGVIYRFPAEPFDPRLELELSDPTPRALYEAFLGVLSRTKNVPDMPLPLNITREEYDITQVMGRVTARLRGGRITFSELFGKRPRRQEVIAVFLAVLELLSLGKIKAVQDSSFGEIMLESGAAVRSVR